MTRAMRAVRVKGVRKALRVGVVIDKTLVEERLLERGTFGPFTRTKSGYVLSLAKVSAGRIARGDRIVDARELGAAIEIDARTRGRITIGETTYLFQLVDPPPAHVRPQLPLSAQRGVEIDWRFTIIAALSFLLHFGFVGALYSDWNDAPADTGFTVQGLVDMAKAIPPAPVEDRTTEPVRTNDVHPTSDKISSSHTSTSTTSTRHDNGAALAAQADAMQMQLLAAFGGDPSIRVRDRSDIPVVDLEGVARSDKGVSTNGDPLVHPQGFLPGPTNNSLRYLGRNDGEGAVHHQTAPDLNPIIFDPILPPPMPNMCGGAERVIANLRPSFRSCYNRGFDEDSTMEGKLVLLVKVAANGEVSSVSKVGGEGLSSKVEQCITSKLQMAEFDAAPGGCNVQVPITFRRQK